MTQKKNVFLRLSLASGVISPMLFLLVLLLEGATRPGYNAWHMVGSLLELSSWGWMQRTNFILCGVLLLCFVLGMKRVLRSGIGSLWGPLLLAIFALGLIVAGVFVTDPTLGYPLGVPSDGSATVHGLIHNVNGLLNFIVLASLLFVFARRFAGDPVWKGWTPFSIMAGILVIVSFFVSGIAGTSPLPGSPAGLFQRIAILVGWGWIAFLAWTLLRKTAKSETMEKRREDPSDPKEGQGESHSTQQ